MFLSTMMLAMITGCLGQSTGNANPPGLMIPPSRFGPLPSLSNSPPAVSPSGVTPSKAPLRGPVMGPTVPDHLSPTVAMGPGNSPNGVVQANSGVSPSGVVPSSPGGTQTGNGAPGSQNPSSGTTQNSTGSDNGSPAGNSFCFVKSTVSATWNHVNNTVNATQFVVNMYISSGNNVTVEVPWRLSVASPDYEAVVQWWNFDIVDQSTGKVDAVAKESWETLGTQLTGKRDQSVVVNVGMIVSTTKKGDINKYPTNVAINETVCVLSNE